MSNKFIMSARQAAELDHAFERNGWTADDVKKLSAGQILSQILPALRRQAKIVLLPHIIDCDATPFQPKGWSVKKHKKGGQFEWSPTKVKLYLAKSQKPGKLVEGNKLRKELEGQKILNANVLDHLLAHPELIPDEWKGNFIFFWGTIYLNSYGDLCVRCLCWGGSRWACSYQEFNRFFSDRRPAAVSASIAA